MGRLLLFLTFLSFQGLGQQKQSFNEKDLLGDWTGIKTKQNAYPIEGFSFKANHIFEFKLGFFERIDDKSKFLGTRGKYKLEKGNLILFTPDAKTWAKLKLLGLHQKHLKISTNEGVFDFSRSVIGNPSSLTFDKIIVSASGSFEPVPVSNTVINANGTVVFEGVDETSKIGLFSGTINARDYLKIQADFNKSNLTKLTAWYRASSSDRQTISTTFIKNGKIYKTIADYGEAAPYLFKAAYIPVIFMYQNMPLKALPDPVYLKNVDLNFRKSDQMLDIRQSELFMLREALRNGKFVQKVFFRRFKFFKYKPNSNKFDELYTDGRYYQFFINGKQIVVDIGFNFYDFNSDKWRWKKDYGSVSMYH